MKKKELSSSKSHFLVRGKVSSETQLWLSQYWKDRFCGQMAPTAWCNQESTMWIPAVYPEYCNSNTQKQSRLYSFYQLYNLLQIKATNWTITTKNPAKRRANFLHPNKFCLCVLLILFPIMRCLLALLYFKQQLPQSASSPRKLSIKWSV